MTATTRRARARGLRRLSGLVLLGHGLLGCEEATPAAGAAATAPATAVVVERVTPRSVTPTLTVPGVVEAERRMELGFRVEGVVARFRVEEGEAVAAGDVLAELDAEDYERERRAARARLEHAAARARDAARKLRRQEELLARETTSREAFEAARSTWEMARASEREAEVALERAEEELARTVLRAPTAGVVERRLLEAHERAPARQPVLVLAELDTVKVRASVADAQLARLRVGAPARVTTPLWPGRSFEGRVARVDVAADRATRTVPFEVALPNPERALRPELAVDVEVPLGEAERRVLVPLGAVLRDAEATPFCFVAAGEGASARAERRPVALGGVHGERVAVRSGLAEGERLIVRGQHFVREGDPVRALREETPP